MLNILKVTVTLAIRDTELPSVTVVDLHRYTVKLVGVPFHLPRYIQVNISSFHLTSISHAPYPNQSQHLGSLILNWRLHREILTLLLYVACAWKESCLNVTVTISLILSMYIYSLCLLKAHSAVRHPTPPPKEKAFAAGYGHRTFHQSCP
jgi:hypothetical protein